MLGQRLLMVGGSGGFTLPTYVLTADEVAFWQDQAALLDPAAYEFVTGTSVSRTVAASERWYLVNGWNVQASGAGTTWFHRQISVDQAMMLSEGTVLTTASTGNPYMYLCKPSLVTGGDARYTDDPRGLYFERIITLGTLTQYQVGATNTGGSATTVNFPTDFTNGFGLHTSVHDVAWLTLLDAGATHGLNTLNEISDTDRIRFAETTMFPFLRTTFPSVYIQGVSESDGRATFTYAKLPGGW